MTKTSEPSLYRERVSPGLSFFLAGLFVPTALFLIVLAFDDLWALVTFVVSEAAIIIIGLLSAPTLVLSRDSISIGKVTIPTKYISGVTVIPQSDQQAEKGPRLQPAAYVRFQVGVKGLIKIELNDPADPTPYWLISSRNPELFTKKFIEVTS